MDLSLRSHARTPFPALCTVAFEKTGCDGVSFWRALFCLTLTTRATRRGPSTSLPQHPFETARARPPRGTRSRSRRRTVRALISFAAESCAFFWLAKRLLAWRRYVSLPGAQRRREGRVAACSRSVCGVATIMTACIHPSIQPSIHSFILLKNSLPSPSHAQVLAHLCEIIFREIVSIVMTCKAVYQPVHVRRVRVKLMRRHEGRYFCTSAKAAICEHRIPRPEEMSR